MAGLLDQYTVAGDALALAVVVRMADYFKARVDDVITRFTINRHWDSLNEESGGMNDVLYKLYQVTVSAGVASRTFKFYRKRGEEHAFVASERLVRARMWRP